MTVTANNLASPADADMFRMTVDETLYARQLDNYLRGRRLHPCLAHILAYEDATATGPCGKRWRSRSTKSTTQETAA